jgi:hypothetical protein
MAGRPGDRWASLRKKAGREESPDTVVFGAKRLGLKGNAPGNARGPTLGQAQASFDDSVTDSATENKPPVQFTSVTGWRKTFSRSDYGSREWAVAGGNAR